MTDVMEQVENHAKDATTMARQAWNDQTLTLRDETGRIATDLRLSLTDRCDLRCAYCLPAEGVEWLDREDILSRAELNRMMRIAVQRLGITQIRLTGGEPLLRPDLIEIAADAHAVFREAGLPPHVALTTNAVGLAGRALALREAGVERINVSLDTLDPRRFTEITGRNRLGDAREGIDAALEAGFTPLKMNSVIMDETSLSEAPDLLRFCLERGMEWRAIEYMPFGPLTVRITEGRRVDFAALTDRLEQFFHLEPLREGIDIHAPATRYAVFDISGTKRLGTMGLIASVSHPFCATCNRTRLSPTGLVHPCLFSDLSLNLGEMLRHGASDLEIAAAWAGVTLRKPPGHGLGQRGFQSPTISMAKIGG